MNYSKKYSHIDKNQRFLIENLRYKNFSIREIASILHVSPSTISRELKRNSDNNGNYLSDTADIKAKNRA
ncbi:helix-turn-helix domain-containing protein, partial [Mycoplasma simbae]